MKADNEQLSALIDSELVKESLLDELIVDKKQQAQFSRYHLIGDVMRGEVKEPLLDLDFSDKVMAEINKQPAMENVTKLEFAENKTAQQNSSNIISFVKRFGQYAIAASVAGIVVVTSLVTSMPSVDPSDSKIEVLNTVPFGGSAAPVSLETKQSQSELAIKERNERLEALLKDHQLQLRTQP